MELKRGSIFTPDKKKYLIDEIQKEITLVDSSIRAGLVGLSSMKNLKKIREDLQVTLNILIDKKGVVTPQETDDVLELIGESKRSRLEKEFYMGMKKSTIYLVLFIAVGAGLYFYTKKKG